MVVESAQRAQFTFLGRPGPPKPINNGEGKWHFSYHFLALPIGDYVTKLLCGYKTPLPDGDCCMKIKEYHKYIVF